MGLFNRSKDQQTPITAELIHEIIRAGVAARNVENYTQRAAASFAKEPDVEKRWESARKVVAETMRNKEGNFSHLAQEATDHEVRRCLDWIEEQRCESESFWVKVGTHLVASVIAGGIGFAVLLGSMVYAHLHQGDPAAQAVAAGAGKLVEFVTPETGSPPGHETGHGRPASSGTAGK
jgi:hypothetical protein